MLKHNSSINTLLNAGEGLYLRHVTAGDRQHAHLLVRLQGFLGFPLLNEYLLLFSHFNRVY